MDIGVGAPMPRYLSPLSVPGSCGSRWPAVYQPCPAIYHPPACLALVDRDGPGQLERQLGALRRLQPYVLGAATVCWGLQPYVLEPAACAAPPAG